MLITLSNPDQFCEAMGAFDLRVTALGAAPFRAELTSHKLERLTCIRGSITATISHSSPCPEQTTIIFLAEDSPPLIRNGVEVTAEHLIVWPARIECHTRVTAPCDWRIISLANSDLDFAMRAVAGAILRNSHQIARLRPAASLMHELRRLYDIATHGSTNSSHKRLADDRLLIAIVNSLVAEESTNIGRMLAMNAVSRFRERVEETVEWPLSLLDLSASIGVSLRTLGRYCNECFNVSPSRYVFLHRMNLVRRTLVAADPSAFTIAAVAQRYGFHELGRFTKSYRELFGEIPSATLHR